MKLEIREINATVDVNSIEELDRILKDVYNYDESLGLSFDRGNVENEPVEALSFQFSDTMTINVGDYDWVTVRLIGE